jgi:hypothetical protein
MGDAPAVAGRSARSEPTARSSSQEQMDRSSEGALAGSEPAPLLCFRSRPLVPPSEPDATARESVPASWLPDVPAGRVGSATGTDGATGIEPDPGHARRSARQSSAGEAEPRLVRCPVLERHDELGTLPCPVTVGLPDVDVLVGQSHRTAGRCSQPCWHSVDRIGRPSHAVDEDDLGSPGQNIHPLEARSENLTGTALPALTTFQTFGLSTGRKKPLQR